MNIVERTPQSLGWKRRPDLDRGGPTNPFDPYEYVAWEKPDGSIHLHTGRTKDGWKPLVIYVAET